ncbi:832_t:CDS:1, partial [Ambispora leptoticha]
DWTKQFKLGTITVTNLFKLQKLAYKYNKKDLIQGIKKVILEKGLNNNQINT